MKTTIVDYDAGNVKSVFKALEAIGISPSISGDRTELEKTDFLVLPGQGSFPSCMEKLTKHDLHRTVLAHIASGKPFLGICVGLQLLFEVSCENGNYKGLGIFKGDVVPFNNKTLKVPHMGWNSLDMKQKDIFKGIDENPYYYFVHSYYIRPKDDDIIAATTTYGDVEFVSAIQKDNVVATQFHPEKSSENGLKLLSNVIKQIG